MKYIITKSILCVCLKGDKIKQNIFSIKNEKSLAPFINCLSSEVMDITTQNCQLKNIPSVVDPFGRGEEPM